MTDFIMNDFSLSAVTLTDSYCANAFEKEVEYLVSFDVDRLLAGFRETAGLDTKGAVRYPCWENMLIGGHCVGHYIVACANAIKTPNCSPENKKKLTEILSSLLDGFEECQKAIGTGFIFCATLADKNNIEAQFDNVEEGKTNIITQAWVPWYTMHKIIEGLLSVAELSVFKNQTLTILEDLTNWIYNRVTKWDEATHCTVLGIEYGGMNDCLYSYYKISGNEKALVCAKAFDDEDLFKKISSAKIGDDALKGKHANTNIPKFIGALNRYVVTGEKAFFEYAANFWNLVTTAHTYVTGGNSIWEHFGEDNNLYSKLSNCNCETCNSYNMLKLTKLLYQITGDKVYADWYEHTFRNSILASQNPETGMTTYFQPMGSGYFKVYNKPFEHFWCCTGTGMENFSKLGESFYFTKGTELFVNQYISSELNWQEKGVTVIQTSEIPQKDFSCLTFKGAFEGKLALRIPQWAAGKVSISVNNQPYNWKEADGYAIVEGTFDENTEIKITIPMKITAYNLPDCKNAYAFKYGPIVLSALLGDADKKTAINGVNVTVPENSLIQAEYVPSQTDIVAVKAMSAEMFIENINEYLVRNGEKLEFELKGTDSKLIYIPHYLQCQQRYGLYFRFVDEESAKLIMEDKTSQAYINAKKLDTVQPGYGQYENDDLHKMTEYGNGSAGQTYHGTSRWAKEGGSFSYRMIVDEKGTDLLVMFDPADNGKTIVIKAGDCVLYDAVIDCKDLKGFNKITLQIPEEAYKKSEKVRHLEKDCSALTFTISGKNGERSAQLCEFMYTLKRR